jgi:hypothetical protein
VDRIPEDSATGKPEKGYNFRGNFLDLRTFAFVLTDQSHTLETAGQAFSVEHEKQHALHHGWVTEEYIDYNRRDVLATSELAEKLLDELGKHAIARPATQLFSPASLGKDYLSAMGIKPIFERQPDFPREYLGYAQSAFHGGRVNVHIRKIACPIVYLDFVSMYPTVNILMGLWRFVTAREIKVVEHCAAEIEVFLRGLTANDLFNPETWKNMTGFVKVIPNGDILPARSKYGEASNDWQGGLNHLYGDSGDALWFSIPDILFSVIRSGRVPNIVDAFRIVPSGTLPGLKPIKLRGTIHTDPHKQDFYKVVVDERHRVSSRSELPDVERRRLERSLKVLANATSYGIFAEMNPQDTDKKVKATCHGIDAEPFKCTVRHPDVPGEYCFPPLASLITGGARLMLGLLEHCVSELGGTYVMEDTDSMAIVATQNGGLVPCPGGPFEMKDGRSAVKALTWKEVNQLSLCFAALNPYGTELSSILKIERDNYDAVTGEQRQLYCFAISAKRYGLFLLDEDGVPILLRKGVNNHEDGWSEHGLGHLKNPTDLESDDRDWIAQAWTAIIRRSLGLYSLPLDFEHLPAIGRITINSPTEMRSLAKLNIGRRYANKLKPFNFLLTCHVKPFGYPPGVDPERFQLIAPYEHNPRYWLEMPWIDRYSGNQYRITTQGFHGSRVAARVKTYGDVLREYEFHPGSKNADAKGKPSGKQTIGLLQRRHIRVARIVYIGRESNRLEDVDAGTIHLAESVYTEYPDPRRNQWQSRLLPALKKIPVASLIKLSRKSRSMLTRARRGKSIPRKKNQELLASILRKLGSV